MDDIVSGSFTQRRWQFWRPQSIRVVDWNIDRGLRLPEIADFLASQQADLIILQEVDLNARRTRRVNVAEELARKLGMNFVFGREFEELTQGSPRSAAYHGQATLSRWCLSNPRIIRFRSQSGFWRPRWFLPRTSPFQERLGGRIALATEVSIPGTILTIYNLHLESRGSDELRLSQLQETLDDSATYSHATPVLVAGDLNFDISRGAAASAVQQAGFRNVFGQSQFGTRPPHNLFGNARSIDWALLAGEPQATLAKVHTSVKASDHYPISFTLRF
ncbi:MAG: endonuclease/exonuclease/phosphatase family protein [Bryobacterales bacterium]|nr:endonuclease/exonuclease/phosphatase family protein [Bryobacterales bacterium]